MQEVGWNEWVGKWEKKIESRNGGKMCKYGDVRYDDQQLQWKQASPEAERTDPDPVPPDPDPDPVGRIHQTGQRSTAAGWGCSGCKY